VTFPTDKPQKPAHGRLMKVRRAADYLDLSVWTLRRLVQEGQLPVVQLPGHSPWLLDQCDLDAWIEKHKGEYR
jgi:excisionase family DNA binding protein